MTSAAITRDTAQARRCLGPCGGRKLTSAKSLALGYGRTCLRRIREAALAEARAGFSTEQQAKADELIRDGGLVPTNREGVFRAVSSDGTASYLVHTSVCNCRAGLKGRRCYHLLAARVLTIASRRSLAKAA